MVIDGRASATYGTAITSRPRAGNVAATSVVSKTQYEDRAESRNVPAGRPPTSTVPSAPVVMLLDHADATPSSRLLQVISIPGRGRLLVSTTSRNRRLPGRMTIRRVSPSTRSLGSSTSR